MVCNSISTVFASQYSPVNYLLEVLPIFVLETYCQLTGIPKLIPINISPETCGETLVFVHDDLTDRVLLQSFLRAFADKRSNKTSSAEIYDGRGGVTELFRDKVTTSKYAAVDKRNVFIIGNAL
jgi:hypothetical protein